MESSRWERVQALFHAISDLPKPRQREILLSECGGDSELAAEVMEMLAGDSGSSLLLDRSVAHVAGAIFNDSSTPSTAYERIGPYQITRVLGEGGMGIVFLAVRPDLGSLAAIKILRDAWISPARRLRFAQEQRLLAQLSHSNIARLMDADTLPDGTPYFVMEYVDGLPLDVYCQRNNCSVRQRIELFRSVCHAVQFAHQHAVIHRDLKPSNVLVTPDGTVKLLDFGIAKQIDNLIPPADQTRTVLRLLTPAYASPEQISGAHVGIHTDVYSLGVILYQLLTGRVPFDGASLSAPDALAMRVPVRPSLVARRVRAQSSADQSGPFADRGQWQDLDVLCLTAMHADVEKRYVSAEALSRDVERYLSGDTLEARPDTFSYRLRKFVGRHRLAVLVGSASAAAVLALIVFFTWRLASERNAAIAEAERAQRIQHFMLNLFAGGDKQAGPASDLRVSTLLERGVVEARALHQDPVVQAELYQTLGDMYHRLGNLENAEALLQASLERRRILGAGSTASQAESLEALGLLRLSQARLDEAENLTRDALTKSKNSLPKGHPGIAAAYDALGLVLAEKGDYQQAISILREAVRLRSEAGASEADLGASQSALANAYFYAGRYQDAQLLDEHVLSLQRRLYGDRHPLVADTLTNLGAVQQQLGNYPKAEKFHRQALAINRAFYGENHYETASSMTMIARALVFENHPDEAANLLRQSLAIQGRIFGPNHPRVASALNELGTVALSRNQFADARHDFEQAAQIYRKTYGEHHSVGVAVSNLGSVLLAEKKYADAEKHFREALSVFGHTLPADHIDIGIARCKLGRTLLRQKRFADAEPEALAAYRILKKRAAPSASWLKNARADLADIYQALQQTDRAASYRAELAQAAR